MRISESVIPYDPGAPSQTALSENSARLGFNLVNDSGVTVTVRYGNPPDGLRFTYKLGPGDTLDCTASMGIARVWLGPVFFKWDNATAGRLVVNEFTE